MTTKHTPGPWSVGPIIHYSRDGRAITGDIPSVSMSGGCRALVVGLGAPGPECAANAALIASAPDLLAERDRLTATALELAEALADTALVIDDEEEYTTPRNKRLARALRAYREARRPDPRARLRALIEQHGGDDREALLAVLEAAP